MEKNIESKREQEKKLVSQMIALYCKDLHKASYEASSRDTKGGSLYRGGNLEKVVLCEECAKLEAYARLRSEKCPFMETKTFCSNCKVHCYKPDMRQKIREVMRYSGPRMIFYHPITAIRHVIETKKEKKRLEKENES
ncbi:MAG: nitrous oxide-stimulated promoter family protein [Agathobacter sp.]|nr:nitrous oxide-stimulated promoter family protein [Agathobacter sp.]